MTPFAIITAALSKVPPRVRAGLLLTFAGAVVVTQLLEAFDVNVVEGVYKALTIIGGYLGVQSAANVPAVQSAVGLEPEEH